MRETRQSGSEGGGDELNHLSLPLCAPASVHSQGGESPPQACALRPVTNGNCVTARWGGEQPEVSDQSVGDERDSAGVSR
jgi:hypothetical protein